MRVRVYLDGVPVGEQLAGGPLEFSVTSIADGQHTFTAQAEDAAGNRHVLHGAAAGDRQDDGAGGADVRSGQPQRHSTISRSCDQSAQCATACATEPGATIKLLETAEIVASDAKGVFSFYPIALDDFQDYSFTMQATDLAGNISQFTRTITRSDIAETDLQRLVVTLSVSTSVSRVGGTVTLTVTATDNVGVPSSHLYIDGVEVPLDVNGQLDALLGHAGRANGHRQSI